MLILDEPTNHLDIPGKEALELSLKGFTGSILFVSHDRYFIQQMATGLLILSNDGCKFVNQTYDEYMNQQPLQVKEVKPSNDEIINKKEVRRALSPEARRREIAKLERLITEKEAELEEMRELRFEPEYYQDYQKMNDLDQDIDDIHNELAHLEERWASLLEEVA